MKITGHYLCYSDNMKVEFEVFDKSQAWQNAEKARNSI